MRALMNRQSTVAAMITELCRQVLLFAKANFFLPLTGDFPAQQDQINAFTAIVQGNIAIVNTSV